ncbi:MAG: metal ABC transporter substrate-binding protein [Candidatus Heimdallarchaeota archaeon]
MTATNRKVLWAAFLLLLIFSMQNLPFQKTVQIPSLDTKKVVTLSALEQHLVEIIGGDKFTVTPILGPSEPPFWHEATPDEITAVSEADILFIVDLEYLVANSTSFDWLGPLLEASDTSGLVQIDLYRNITMRVDPVLGRINHLAWTDPRNVRIMVEDIANELGKLDTSNQAIFKANQVAYQAQLDSLVTDMISQASPYNGTKVVTASSQSWLFLDLIGFEKVGQIVQDPSGDVTAQEIAEIEEIIFEEDVNWLIFDWPGPKSFAPAAIETVIQDTGIKSVDFESDVYPTTSYLEIIEDNVERIVGAIEGSSEKDSKDISGFDWNISLFSAIMIAMLVISQTRKRRFNKSQTKLYE